MSHGDIGAALTIAAVAAPLVLAIAALIPRAAPLALGLAPWAASPALLVAVGFTGRAPVELDAVALGMKLGSADALAQSYLLFTAALWTASGLFARAYVTEGPHRARFFSYWLAACAGNIGLILARDVASFYAFYATMTFAAYGLIAHDETKAARYAGNVYLVMALAGEMLLLSAFVLIAGAEVDVDLERVPEIVASSRWSGTIVVLIFVGFGVKAGAMLLHVWLPLAHPVAPTPASAVLSGAMIAAGLFGWLRFLPLGEVAMPALGLGCAVAGVVAAFYGIGIGLTNRDPKTILAYSSVSQMGFMTTAVGIGLASQDAAPAVLGATLFYAVHHGLAKGALFLGVGVASEARSGWPRRLVTLGLLWPALDISGAPLSSGALAKHSLKSALELAPSGAAALSSVLAVGAVGSTVLMVHFLRHVFPRGGAERGAPSLGLVLPWALLLLLDLLVLVRPPVRVEELTVLLRADEIVSSAWPVLAGIGIAMTAALLRRRGLGVDVEVPAGDLLHLVALAWRRLARPLRAAETWVVAAGARGRARVEPLLEGGARRALGAAARAEASMAAFATIGVLFVLLLVGLLAVLFFPAH